MSRRPAALEFVWTSFSVFGIALGAARIAGAAPAVRESIDQDDFDRMTVSAPHAADLLERGEAMAVAGDLASAEALFLEAHQEYPAGALILRRRCQVLTALGRREQAVTACSLALQSSRSNANFRAMVRALVDGPTPPTVRELADALTFVARERDRTAKGSPVPLAATCDIAESVGDAIMLQRCAEELTQFAPNDPDTRRAIAALDSRCPLWRFWTGWIALFLAIALTVGHAVRRLGRRGRVATAVGLMVWLALVAFSSAANATPENAEPGFLSRWRVDDAAPETKIPSEKDRNADPLEFGYWLQDVALKADRASNRGDHAAAIRYYQAIATAVPDRAIGFTRMCSEYEAMGDRDHAVGACGAALLRDGLRVQDYVRYVHLVLAKPGPLTQDETKSLDQVVTHMKDDPAGKGAADDLECQIATRTSNVGELEGCTQALVARAPNDPQTVSYQWALAMQRGQFDEAKILIDRGSALGLQNDGVANMRRATQKGVDQRRRRMLLSALAAALLVGALAVAVRALIRRRAVLPSPA